MKFGEVWSARFFGTAYPYVGKIYDLMYPEGQEYLSIEEAREGIDKFLLRVSSLKVFI